MTPLPLRAIIVVIVIILITGCDSRNPARLQTTSLAEASKEVDCLIGDWTITENGITKSFIFEADQTGREIQAPTDVRPYRWQREGEKISLMYTTDNTKTWDLTVDCNANELKVFGTAYRRSAVTASAHPQ